jgi:hypothetical protein
MDIQTAYIIIILSICTLVAFSITLEDFFIMVVVPMLSIVSLGGILIASLCLIGVH